MIVAGGASHGVSHEDSHVSLARYEILAGDLRRRHWPQALKEEVVLETLAAGATVTQVARRRGIDRSLIYRWRREMKIGRAAQAQTFLPVQVSEAKPPAVSGSDSGPAAAEPPESATRGGGRPTGRMEIALDRGRRITVFADVDAAALARVIGVLDGR
jgi:transposase